MGARVDAPTLQRVEGGDEELFTVTQSESEILEKVFGE
jgi:hypothetical protein